MELTDLQELLCVVVDCVGGHVHKLAGHAKERDVDVGNLSDVGQTVLLCVLGFEDAALHLPLCHCKIRQ